MDAFPLENRVMDTKKYCESLTTYKRLATRVVDIGDVPVGGDYPIRIQSMTTTDTMDVAGTVAQSIRMIESGCEYIRITAPSKNEAESLAEIKKELRKRGYSAPLVADIHFTPNAAEIAARIVEKVRINPGNYADKKKFEFKEYSDSAYQAELNRIYQRFAPLVKICKEYGTAMRVGVNHGSLSDRIMSRYGDTPLGMVESAMEFIRICEDLNYYQIVVSMKSSNPLVMIQAYRLLVQTLIEHGIVYPLHLGVTEAGEGEDGRIKSAFGIGTLLADGLGDTVRVSLTEPPEEEAPVAKYITSFSTLNRAPENLPFISLPINPIAYVRRVSRPILNWGGDSVPRVVADFSSGARVETDLAPIGHIFSPIADKWTMDDLGADYIFAGDNLIPFMLPNGLKAIYNYETWLKNVIHSESYPFYPSFSEFIHAKETHSDLNFVAFSLTDVDFLTDAPNVVYVLDETFSIQGWRNALFRLSLKGIQAPVLLKAEIEVEDFGVVQTDVAAFQLTAACMAGELLADGLIDGLWLISNKVPKETINRTAFGVLQAARTRITRTEYISCPSCGRTLFDLQETTALIRGRTEHLKGVKIAIMGCIVNGPGEMADADYGYVGSGPGVISLYRGKEAIEKNVKTEFAVATLIELIRADGRWIEP